jgi:hypothetical protein
VSAIGRLSYEGDLWLGRAGVQALALPDFFTHMAFITHARELSNKKAKCSQETKKVKRRFYFVKLPAAAFHFHPTTCHPEPEQAMMRTSNLHGSYAGEGPAPLHKNGKIPAA